MKSEFDLTKMVEEITMQSKETQEEFIFETIQPYCENVLQRKINKEELKQILLNGVKIPTTMQFQEYRSKRFLPPDKPYDAGFIALLKQALAEGMIEEIKDNITYEVNTECMAPTITASIYIGRK